MNEDVLVDDSVSKGTGVQLDQQLSLLHHRTVRNKSHDGGSSLDLIPERDLLLRLYRAGLQHADRQRAALGHEGGKVARRILGAADDFEPDDDQGD